MTVMPWKNGLGTTTEVAIHPAGSSLAAGDFEWRVSVSEVLSDGPFSTFAGCDRLLAVWKGSGLALKSGGEHFELAPMKPFRFPGDVATQAHLRGGPILDLGVICRRGKAEATMRIVTHAELDQTLSIEPSSGTQLLFCTRGAIECCGETATEGDALRFDAGERHLVKASQRAPCGALLILISN